MKLVFKSIKAEGIKGLSGAEFPLSGSLVAIKGSNGVGKTTLLALMQMFAQRKKNLKIPQPIMEGMEQGSATAEFVDEEGRIFAMSYTATRKEGETVSHSMRYTIDGESFPQKAVKHLYGDAPVVFDISTFIRNQSSAAGRMKNIRNFFQGVLGLNFDETDAEIVKKQDELKDRKDNIKGKMPVIEALGLTPGDIIQMADTPPEVDGNLKVEYDEALEHNAKLPLLRAEMNRCAIRVKEGKDELEKTSKEISKIDGEMSKIDQQIKDLQELLHKKHQELESEIDRSRTIQAENQAKEATYQAAVKAVDEFEEIDTQEISLAIQESVANQERHKQAIRMKATAHDILQDQEEIPNLERAIKILIDSKRDIVKDAVEKVNLPEFMFFHVDQDGQIKLMYRDELTGEKGVDFIQGQVRDSAMVAASAAMGAIQNQDTDMRVIFMENATLLDKKNLEYIHKYLNERGFQLIAEIVTNEALEIECND